MADTFFRFKVGEISCTVLSDGRIEGPDTISKRPFDRHVPGSGITIDVLSLLVQTQNHCVLIDTGCGIGGKHITGGRLFENLKAAGTALQYIDTVIITHAHSDHLGGNLDQNGYPAFPSARYILHRKDWEYWVESFQNGKVDKLKMCITAQEKLIPLGSKLQLIDEESEIVPGIKYLPAFGHTPGHMMLEISSGEERLVCCADLMHHPLEFAVPELFTIFDTRPEQAVPTRQAIATELAGAGARIFACHFDFPGLGNLVKKGKYYRWQPE